MSFWGFFKRAAVYVGLALKRAFGSQPAQEFAKGALAILGTELGKVALLVVGDLSASTLTNAEKRAAAFARIAAVAKLGGISVTDSIINLVIEVALTAIKNGFAPRI